MDDAETPRAKDPHAGHDGSLEYHQRLLSDPHRLEAYDRALRTLVKPGDRVLDAGAGTGVLAMLAARAGAGRVFAVESMPIATLAKTLIAHNELEDRVELIEADLRTLPPRGEVDLVVSDCLGRFLLDDHMGPAMEAAFCWLAPNGRVVPSRIDLMVAPIAMPPDAFPVIDAFKHPVLGLDLSPASTLATHAVWGAMLGPSTLLATPQVFATWTLPGPPPEWRKQLEFVLSPTAGDAPLRGLAGWFRAELAPDVILETGPGHETHWHQLLLPLPPTRVEAGDHLELELSLETDLPEPRWRRRGTITTRVGALAFDLGTERPPAHQATRWQTPEGPGSDAETLNDLGGLAWSEGRLEDARRYFEDAVITLTAGESFPGLFENLGIARLTLGSAEAAILPFLRALDGVFGSREQSARLLVDACFHAGRHLDGARYLHRYERTFGPHPGGWTPQESTSKS